MDTPNFIEFSPALVSFRRSTKRPAMIITVEVDEVDLMDMEKFPEMHQVGKLAFYWEDDE